jgi:hypothetical protein
MSYEQNHRHEQQPECDCEYIGKCKNDPQRADYCPLRHETRSDLLKGMSEDEAKKLVYAFKNVSYGEALSQEGSSYWKHYTVARKIYEKQLLLALTAPKQLPPTDLGAKLDEFIQCEVPI